jgi:hypothetical protein
MIAGITAQVVPAVVAPVYSPGAVLFTNSGGTHTKLSVASQSQGNPNTLTTSLFFFAPTGPAMQTGFMEWAETGSGDDSYVFSGFNSAGDIDVALQTTTPASFSFASGSGGGIVTPAVWHHLFISADTNHAAGSKLRNLYLDGVNVLASTSDTHVAAPIWVNSRAWGIPFVGTAGLTQNVALAEVWCAYGVYLDASHIPLFRDSANHPVSVGANGSTPTGSPPDYYFSGGASTFATNKGSGAQPTLTGTLANYSPGP